MQEQIIDGRYRICGRIGQGGMSTVYLAEELQTKEQVALKWVRRAQMRRFGISEQDVQREAELMRGIDHPALPRIREQFVSEEGCIIVMDRVKGQTLADILHRDGTLSVRQTCDLGIRLCQVLSCLHAAHPPVIYRDMKPENVMIDEQGGVHLIDFGIACRYGEQERDVRFLGTPGYAPAEQLAGERCDPRTDIYALGKTLWQAAYGREMNEQAQKTRLQRILARCMDERMQDRYPNCRLLAKDLRRCRHRRAILLSRALTASALTAMSVLLIWQGTGPGEDTVLRKCRRLIQAVQADGIFTPEEEEELLAWVDACGSQRVRAQTSYMLGELYWQMYPGMQEASAWQRMKLAVPWFVNALADEALQDDARAYVAIGTFYQRMASDDLQAEELSALWRQMRASLQERAGDEDLQLQLCTAVCIMCGEHDALLAEAGIDREAQKAMLVRVQARLDELPAEKTAALREHARALEEAADAAERKDE